MPESTVLTEQVRLAGVKKLPPNTLLHSSPGGTIRHLEEGLQSRPRGMGVVNPEFARLRWIRSHLSTRANVPNQHRNTTF